MQGLLLYGSMLLVPSICFAVMFAVDRERKKRLILRKGRARREQLDRDISAEKKRDWKLIAKATEHRIISCSAVELVQNMKKGEFSVEDVITVYCRRIL